MKQGYLHFEILTRYFTQQMEKEKPEFEELQFSIAQLEVPNPQWHVFRAHFQELLAEDASAHGLLRRFFDENFDLWEGKGYLYFRPDEVVRMAAILERGRFEPSLSYFPQLRALWKRAAQQSLGVLLHADVK